MTIFSEEETANMYYRMDVLEMLLRVTTVQLWHEGRSQSITFLESDSPAARLDRLVQAAQRTLFMEVPHEAKG